MGHAASVQSGEPGEHVEHDRDALRPRQRPIFEAGVEALTINQLEHDVAAAADPAEVVGGHQIRMSDLCRELPLLHEAADQDRVRVVLGVQHLDGDPGSGGHVERRVDRGHAPAADPPLQLVALAEEHAREVMAGWEA